MGMEETMSLRTFILGAFATLTGLPLLWLFLSFFLLPLIGFPMFGDN